MRFLKIKKVIELTGLSRSTIYAKINSGDFPSQISISQRSVAWLEEDIFTWMRNLL